MSFFGAAWRAIEIGREQAAAVEAGMRRLREDGNPLAALRAYARATQGALDDQAVAAIEDGLRRVIGTLELGTRLALTLAESLSDPRVREGLDRAIGAAIEAGYQAGRWRVTLRRWLEEGER